MKITAWKLGKGNVTVKNARFEQELGIFNDG
jgi:hypothetical protein